MNRCNYVYLISKFIYYAFPIKMFFYKYSDVALEMW